MPLNQTAIDHRCLELSAIGVLERQVGIEGNLWKPTEKFTSRVNELLKTLPHPKREKPEQRKLAALIQAFLEIAKVAENKAMLETMQILGAFDY